MDELGEKEEGTVSYVNGEKGYGFIEIPGRTKNIFFHAKHVKQTTFETIQKGSHVEVYGITSTPKGYNATAVYLSS